MLATEVNLVQFLFCNVSYKYVHGSDKRTFSGPNPAYLRS